MYLTTLGRQAWFKTVNNRQFFFFIISEKKADVLHIMYSVIRFPASIFCFLFLNHIFALIGRLIFAWSNLWFEFWKKFRAVSGIAFRGKTAVIQGTECSNEVEWHVSTHNFETLSFGFDNRIYLSFDPIWSAYFVEASVWEQELQ